MVVVWGGWFTEGICTGGNICPYFSYVQKLHEVLHIKTPTCVVPLSTSGLEYVFFDLKSLPTANAPAPTSKKVEHVWYHHLLTWPAPSYNARTPLPILPVLNTSRKPAPQHSSKIHSKVIP